MKPLDLGQEVLSAQGQILSRTALRVARRAAFGVVALTFLFFFVIGLHGLLWALCLDVGGFSHVKAALCVLGFDLLFVVIFGALAAWSIPDMVTIEARIRRDRKLNELKQAIALSTLTGLLIGPIGRGMAGSLLSVFKSVLRRKG
ncbi:hypothetical protein AA106555_0488 [Neokomagataea thailandica NBRC 106555]|uniref:Phage holin family protein n=2 Tax=Neokomagataea TaxID=1223423 RepID=A0A4Y6VAI0_9PROT|nr:MULTISPECIES: hypothetical protein [Neokomagataea]QDH25526.1 hypothetical protein D5366_10230 [Neokomagataea tanensis]GBR51267.1 hypothetical protein AA106555_0488 [Neokomagataea thailandica NBRC 106555]